MEYFKKSLKKVMQFIVLINFIYINGQESSDAYELLTNVSNKFQSYKNVSFDFNYILENKSEKIRQEIKGDATISKKLYKINFLEAIQLFDGNKVYTIIPENEEITIIDPNNENDDLGINISNIFKFYKEGYSFEWDIKQKIDGNIIQYIKLLPDTSNNELKYILIGINELKMTLYRIIEIGYENTQTTLTLLNQKENIDLSDDYFKFKKESYPDYYINQ
tara:strand:- start:4080 stop:4739 length:660 start_codon:yes stop_codon:yes gene_type:complete